MQLVAVVNNLLALLTIFSHFLIIVVVISLIVKSKITKNIINFFGKYALQFIFTIALTSMLGSLFYSEIAHFAPCVLCWYQRILMYPQVFLLGMALFKKDRKIVDYSLLLSVIGAFIAIYHYMLQRGVVNEVVPCTIVGYSASCAQTFVMTYGYITIPLMSFSAFILIILLCVARKKVV